MIDLLRRIFRKNIIIVGYGFPAYSDTYFEFKYNRKTERWIVSKYDSAKPRPLIKDIDIDLMEYDKRATAKEIQAVKDFLKIRRRNAWVKMTNVR